MTAVTTHPDEEPAEAPKWKTLSVRLVPEFKEVVGRRAQRDGLEASVWAREVLSAVVAANLSLEDLTQLLKAQDGGEEPFANPVRDQPGVRVLGARVIERAACLHPMHIRREYPTFDLCACGQHFPR